MQTETSTQQETEKPVQISFQLFLATLVASFCVTFGALAAVYNLVAQGEIPWVTLGVSLTSVVVALLLYWREKRLA